MKNLLPLTLLLLSCLLTACPGSQTPALNLEGAWSGSLTHTADGVAVPLTAVFTQTESSLGGTASLGTVPYQSSGNVTGELEGSNVTFAFSFVASETSNGEEVEQTIGTYTFTGTLSDNALSGDFVASSEDSDITIPGTFELARQ